MTNTNERQQKKNEEEEEKTKHKCNVYISLNATNMEQNKLTLFYECEHHHAIASIRLPLMCSGKVDNGKTSTSTTTTLTLVIIMAIVRYIDVMSWSRSQLTKNYSDYEQNASNTICVSSHLNDTSLLDLHCLIILF